MMHPFLRRRGTPPVVVGTLIGGSLVLLLAGMYLLLG
jgi:hypothetical protein